MLRINVNAIYKIVFNQFVYVYYAEVSYSELWITPILWPDFTEKDLHDALDSFSHRERRYGNVLESS